MNPTNWAWFPPVLTFPLWSAMAAAMLISPRVSRPDVFFAITVPLTFRQSPAGRAIQRRYDWSIAIITVITLTLGLPMNLSPWVHIPLPMFLLAVALEMAGGLGAFIAARHRTMRYHVEPNAVREADLQPGRASLPGGWLAQAGPFLILGAAALYLWLRWGDMPERFPTHWGLDGTPNGWGTKDVFSVFWLIGLGALPCLLIAVLAGRRGVRWTFHGGSRSPYGERFVRIRSVFLLGLQYWLALMVATASLAALGAKSPLPGLWCIPFAFALLVVLLIAFWIAQKRWDGATPAAAPVGDRTPDRCWKLGLFYVNPDDPAVFVEKRFGIGWTCNLGNPRTWFFIGALLLVPLAILALSLLAAKGGAGVAPAQ